MRIIFIIKLSVLSVILSAFTLKSCKKEGGDSQRSVILWKSTEGLNETDEEVLNSLSVSHTYIRYADVEWNPVYERHEPVKGVNAWNFDYMSANSTAVIFITNEVLVNLTYPKMKDLALKIAALYKDRHEEFAKRYGNIFGYYRNTNPDLDHETKRAQADSITTDWMKRNNKLLIDCDWSETTRDKYFALIKELKTELRDTEIQSTLRLWQYRDYKLAGIPPVERCLLMCYSTGDPKNPNTENAIVDFATIKKYITHSRYQTDLDIALPVYSWGTLFRNGEFAGIISPLTLNYLEGNPSLFQQNDSTHFTILRDTVLGNTYYRYGDKLHFQGVNIEELLEIARFIKSKLKPGEEDKISLFSYDPLYFNQIGHENIRKIYRVFSNPVSFLTE
ncbi:MAG: hypothetical protein C0592_12450 [Marinilabiliales bacterium]|nr:MAG: hypothetical protein C0592_12450 [Marinilabiliales bacterium]